MSWFALVYLLLLVSASDISVTMRLLTLLQDVEVRQQLRTVVDLLEGGLSELVKIAAELRSLIQTIDDVTKQVESQCGTGLDKECFDHNCCWRGRDINQNVPTPLSEVHWQTYASQDWFSGFKHFPRLKDARERIASFENPSSGRPSCKYYDQVAEVLLQIGHILNSLETSHTCSQDDADCHMLASDVNSKVDFPDNAAITRKESWKLPSDYSDSDYSWKRSQLSVASSFDVSQNSYLSVLVDVNGDYEETVDYLLETVTGTDVEEEESSDDEKNVLPINEPPPVPVLKVYLRKYIDQENNNSAMESLQTYFD